ncbi:MAG: hypothetical protein ACOYOQ_00175 [Microthrixaceae bacterium]
MSDEPLTAAEEKALLRQWLDSVSFVSTGGTPVDDPEGEDDE